MSQLHIYNSLSRKKELFEAVNPPFVGMYVCGPTVYNEVHLGNLRTFMGFDVVYRYLCFLGYKVRYVRNITDVGHLVGDADEGEDKIGKQARLEQIEPMEIVQRYTNSFHRVGEIFNLIPPNIEPTATGHLLEQIAMTEKLIENGYAYESNGSVYFDVPRYAKDHNYGELSGRKLDELLEGTRDLDGQDEKRDPRDFALWKKAPSEHLMKWNSPWSVGFPGWHLECSVMSTKYLGEQFDIHGGGMDLQFPHHECEIAQNTGTTGKKPVNYWMHSNMLTVNGQKMSKSLGNSFLPLELFSGDHELLDQGYSPMTVRFFMLQSHYRSTLDFSNDALKAAESGFTRLMRIWKTALGLTADKAGDPEAEAEILELIAKCKEHMDDDFNTSQTIARLFDLGSFVNKKADGNLKLGEEVIEQIKKTYDGYAGEVLGLRFEEEGDSHLVDGLMELILEIRKSSREKKDWDTSDKIRDTLNAIDIQVKDGKDGSSWEKK